MGVIVIDPGHGGTSDLEGSSHNNAISPSGVLEKTLTLDLARRIRWSLQSGSAKAYADRNGKTSEVFLTRETDINVAGPERAAVAMLRDADLYLSIHFNGWDGTVRGTEAYIDRRFMKGVVVSSAGKTWTQEGPGIPSSGVKNINYEADAAFAAAIVVAARDAMLPFNSGCCLRSDAYTPAYGGDTYRPPDGVKMRGLATLFDASLGTTDNHCRACLLEVEFLDNPDVDLMFNGGRAGEVRNALAAALGRALVDQL